MKSEFSRKLFAEFFGTFMLVFAGTGAIVVNDISGGAIGHAGIAVTFGLIVLAVIYTYGDISGAHINPAVTLAFWVAKRFPGRLVPGYFAAQILGAISASFLLANLVGHASTLGATVPSGTVFQSAVLEFILTWWLMTVILHVSEGAKEKGIVAGIVIGATVALEAMFAGPLSGASMNPARSLAPAVVSGHLEHLWIYLLMTTLGASAAVFTCRCTDRQDCCRSPVKVGPER